MPITTDDLTLFTDVLRRLSELHEAAPEGSALYQPTQEAGADLESLVGYLQPPMAHAAA